MAYILKEMQKMRVRSVGKYKPKRKERGGLFWGVQVQIINSTRFPRKKHKLKYKYFLKENKKQQHPKVQPYTVVVFNRI